MVQAQPRQLDVFPRCGLDWSAQVPDYLDWLIRIEAPFGAVVVVLLPVA